MSINTNRHLSKLAFSSHFTSNHQSSPTHHFLLFLLSPASSKYEQITLNLCSQVVAANVINPRCIYVHKKTTKSPAHVKDPVVNVRAWWIKKTLKYPSMH